MRKKPTPVEEMLPWFQAEAAAQVSAARRERVASQLQHWHWMWPEWDGKFRVGMRVCCGLWGTLVEDGKTVGGFEAKAGQHFYSQMAPAYIVEIVDEETFVVVIDYPKGTDSDEHRVSCEHHNGIKLRFDICDLDPAQDYWINNPDREKNLTMAATTAIGENEGHPTTPETKEENGNTNQTTRDGAIPVFQLAAD